MVAMVNDETLYTFNSKCQKSSKSHASFFILKVSIMILVFDFKCYKKQDVKGKASYSPPNSFDSGSDSTFNKNPT